MPEFINIKSWSDLCDCVYDGEQPLFPSKSCMVYVPLDQIASFFRECEEKENQELEFTVVSACSDYCLCYQRDYPVQKDMRKWIDFIDWNEVQAYEDVTIKSRCYKHQCNIRDKYSLRFYSFTGFTFDRIPKNVKRWYSTNSMVDLVTKIPFGVPDWFIDNYDEKFIKPFDERTIDVYVNFQINTIQRIQIKQYCEKLQSNLKIVVEPEPVEHGEYIQNLGNSKFVICPDGNGFDCYRNLESIYMKAVPLIVTPDPRWSPYGKTFSNIVEALNGLDPNFNFHNEKFYLDFWKDLKGEYKD